MPCRMQHVLKGDKLNAWIKGTKEGNTITIPSGQFLIYGKADDGEYGLQVGYMELIDRKVYTRRW